MFKHWRCSCTHTHIHPYSHTHTANTHTQHTDADCQPMAVRETSRKLLRLGANFDIIDAAVAEYVLLLCVCVVAVCVVANVCVLLL